MNYLQELQKRTCQTQEQSLEKMSQARNWILLDPSTSI
jgi:hypothetical protein